MTANPRANLAARLTTLQVVTLILSVYVLIAIIKKRLNLQASLYELLQILSLTMFEKMPLPQLLELSELPNEPHSAPKQLFLFP